MCSIKIKLDVVLRHKGVTLKELSEKTGLTISNLSNIKNNRIACIRFSTLEKLCPEFKQTMQQCRIHC